MSRSRNIKPGFFKNDRLADLPYEYRLLFQGLWCEADRDGKLEDRPKRIKGDVFPYDNVDVDDGLNRLQAHGFILRYAVDGVRYIKVLAFAKHQNPHKKEALSSIPEPAPCKPGASPVQVSEIPERAALIPDSPFLIPDPLQKQELAPSPSAPAKSPTGSRLSADWTLPDNWRVWAIEARPGFDVVEEAAKFADYWGSKPGKDGRKADWFATWRNWVRNSRASPTTRASPQQQPGKVMSAIMQLEGMKNGLVDAGNSNRDATLALPGTGRTAGR